MNSMKKDKLIKFLNGKGFYVALGICLVATALSVWGGYSSVKKHSTANISSENSPTPSPDTSSETPLTVDTPKDNVPDERENESSEESSTDNLQSAEKTTVPTAKYFIYPVNGEVIKDFSATELQFSLTYNDMRIHTALDIAADLKTAVNSAGDGIVTFAGKDPLLGYTVKIDHGNGITAVYAGLAEAVKVKSGDSVLAGTNIGAIGVVTMECVDAPHLHLEFYDNGTPVSPLTLLSKK